jgi:uncharacterized membrane protein YuzA (DUF378 family)
MTLISFALIGIIGIAVLAWFFDCIAKMGKDKDKEGKK